MKQLRFFAASGALVLAALTAGCAAGDAGDPAAQTGDALSTALPPADAVAIKATTGRDVAGATALPIYVPDQTAPAFYEVDLAPGWAVVSADAAPRVVEWNASGRSPSARLDVSTRAAMKRLYRLDPAVYVAADVHGKALGAPPLLRIDRTGARAALVAVSADDAIQSFHAARTAMQLAQSRGMLATKDDGPPLVGDNPPAETCTVPGDVPSYSQLGPGQAPNTTACDSGCGPTAWATVFGWASRRAVDNKDADSAFASLFKSNGGAVEAPLTMSADVASLSMQINSVVNTRCVSGEGATTPWEMANVTSIVDPTLTVDVHYNFLMMADNGVRDQAIAAICAGRPSIIGIGTMFGNNGHFPIAKGYDNGKFLLEMGWGGDGNGWYDATTWFTGSVHH